MAPLPAELPDTDRRWVLRVPPDPYLRFDTNDYSLDPGLVGRRVEVARRPTRGPGGRAATPASWPAGTRASFARHRTITALDHARTLRASAPSAAAASRPVEVRSLARYDALIA